MQLVYKQVDAFTTIPFGGNPAGVIPDADGLSTEMMQRIAAELNLSETSFVVMPESENVIFRIRFFTPTNEVDLSGHVTIATCFALVEEGKIPLNDGVTQVQFQTAAGNIPVDIHFRGGYASEIGDGDENCVVLGMSDVNVGLLDKIMMHQEIKKYREARVPTSDIAEILGVKEGDILGAGLPMEIISTGLDQLMIPVTSKETLLNMHPDLIKLGLLDRKYGIDTNHIFTLDTFNENCVSYSRHFAPILGMWEDPATGTAAAGLGTYLLRHGVVTTGSMVMEQGKEMENLARILVDVDHSEGESNKASIGGLAVTSIKRKIDIEQDNMVIV